MKTTSDVSDDIEKKCQQTPKVLCDRLDSKTDNKECVQEH